MRPASGGRRAHVGARAGLRTVAAELTYLVVLQPVPVRGKFSSAGTVEQHTQRCRAVYGPECSEHGGREGAAEYG